MPKLITNALTTEIVTLANHRHPYGAKTSTPVTARLTHAMLARVENVATQRRTSVAGLIRLSLSAIAKGDSPKDPMGVLADICQALGMSPDSAPSDVLASVSAVVDELNAQGADPLPSDGATEHADPAPAGKPGTMITSKRGAPPAKRSLTELREERQLLARLKAKGIDSIEAFEALKAKAVTTTR